MESKSVVAAIDSKGLKRDEETAKSDDEVIFLEPIDKTKADGTAAAAPADEKNKPEAPPAETDKDDDVVLVSEDEIEGPSKEPVKSIEKEAASEVLCTDSKPRESAADKDLLEDNTDIACDQFDTPKSHDKVKSAATDYGKSNSSSSSLLRSAESGDQQKSKRVRLSAGSLLQPASEEEEKKLIAKRSRNHVESSPVEGKVEVCNKKLKTDESDSNSSSGTLHSDLDKDVSGDELEQNPGLEANTDADPFGRKFFNTVTRDDLRDLLLGMRALLVP